MELSDKIGKAIRVSSDELIFVTKVVVIPKPLLVLVVLILGVRCQALSENSIVGQRASVFSSGKDGEAGDVGYIVDTAGRRPDGK